MPNTAAIAQKSKDKKIVVKECFLVLNSDLNKVWDVLLSLCPGTKIFPCPAVPLYKCRSKNPKTMTGAPKTEVLTLIHKFFTANILFWEDLGVVCFRPKNQNFF